jgi:hypothetical protein
VFVAATVVAVVTESIQGASVAKILISAWLPALVLAVLWTRRGWPHWLAAAR